MAMMHTCLMLFFFIFPVDIGEDLKVLPEVHEALGVKLGVIESYFRRSIISTKTPYGFLIKEVDPETPAARAGWKKGDILLEWDGRPVRTVAGLNQWIQEAKRGSKVSFKISRLKSLAEGYSRHPWFKIEGEIRLKGIGLPFVDRLQKDRKAAEKVYEMLGADLAVTESYIRRSMISSRPVFGFKISKVDPKSPAARAGWKRGDLLLYWDEQEVKTVVDLEEWIRSAKPGTRVPFKSARRRTPVLIISRDPWEWFEGEIEIE